MELLRICGRGKITWLSFKMKIVLTLTLALILFLAWLSQHNNMVRFSVRIMAILKLSHVIFHLLEYVQ